MKMKLLLLCLVSALSFSANAQTVEEQKKQITEVKKSDLYLYGEAVAATTDDARKLAKELLDMEIRQYVAEKKKSKGETIIASNLQEAQTSINLPRGNMFRSFIYLKKSDIFSANNAEIIAADTRSEVAEVKKQTVYPEVVNTLASFTDYYEMAAKLKQLKEEGKVGHYARYANLENAEIYYMVVYNPDGKVVALLTPGPERKNVKSGQTQKLTDFSGCGAIGFSIKN